MCLTACFDYMYMSLVFRWRSTILCSHWCRHGHIHHTERAACIDKTTKTWVRPEPSGECHDDMWLVKFGGTRRPTNLDSHHVYVGLKIFKPQHISTCVFKQCIQLDRKDTTATARGFLNCVDSRMCCLAFI